MRRELHGLAVTELRAPDGARALVADHGAHLLSWVPASGGEAMYLSDRSGYGGGAAIRGGVPVIFPQFAERGSGKRHGFARTAAWRLEWTGEEGDRAVARYRLTTGDLPAGTWPHDFSLGFEVAVGGRALRMALTVANTSDHPWECHAALHSYWAVHDIAGTLVDGLDGVGYIDQVDGGREAVQPPGQLRIDGEIDRIYRALPGPLRILSGERALRLEQAGFSDAVVWNPGPTKAAALADMAPGDHARFLCVEAGAILRPIALAPSQAWTGSQTVTVLGK